MVDTANDSVSLSGVYTDKGGKIFTNTSHLHVENKSGFWKRRKPSAVGSSGYIPPSFYSLYRNTISSDLDGYYLAESKPLSGGSWKTTQEYRGHVYGADRSNGWTTATGFVPTGVPQSLRDRAFTQARLNLKDQKVNLGVAFAERAATARMIGDNASQIARAFRALKKGRFKKAARELGIANPGKPRGREVTQRWLELQYGWKPLLQDVYGAVDALARRDKHDFIVSAKGTVTERIDEVVTLNRSAPDIIRGVRTTKGMRGTFVRIDAIPGDGLLRPLNSLGMTNPATILWETVPYSFVVDWFLPVGDFIDSMDALLGFDRTWCTASDIERFDCTHVLEKRNEFKTSFNQERRTRRGSQTRHYVKLVRTVYDDTVPLPVLPRFKDPVSLGHMANGLALLASAFSR